MPRHSIGPIPARMFDRFKDVDLGNWPHDILAAVIGAAIFAGLVKLPAMTAYIMNWWAASSLQRRRSRLISMNAELQEYNQLLGDPLNFQARSMQLLARLVVVSATLVFVMVGGSFIVLIRMQKMLAPLHPSENVWLADAVVRVTQGFIPSACVVLLVGMSFTAAKLRNFNDPKRNVLRLEKLISQLQDR